VEEAVCGGSTIEKSFGLMPTPAQCRKPVARFSAQYT
jgi:hypothetical protein